MVGYPIVGLKKTVKELNNCPDGFHLEVWGCCNKDACFVWTSELLTSDEWTEDRMVGHVKLDPDMHEYARAIMDNAGRVASKTELIIEACEQMRRNFGYAEVD